MAFCPICKGDHDSDLPCTMTPQILRNMGIEPPSRRSSKDEFEKIDRRVRKGFLKVVFIILALFVLFVFLTNR